MTSCDVVRALFRGDSPERVGLFGSPWADTLRAWVEQGYPADEAGNPANPMEHFGYDMAGVGGWFDVLPLRGHDEVVEETDDWVIRRNGAGAALKWWKHRSGTPEHIDFRMTSREVWERDYRPHLLAPDRARVNLEAAAAELEKRRAEGRWTFYGHLFIWENMRQSMGDVCMYESLIADPAWVHDYNRVNTDFFKAHYRLLIEEAGMPDGIWIYEDLGYRNGLFCSPAVLEEMIFPYYKELVDFFHGYGLPVIFHSCGGVTDAVPLIVQAGFDGLNPMEVKAGCDVLRFAEQYGDQLLFVGGLDARILESGDRAVIRKGVTAFMEGMKARGARFLFASDHSLSTQVGFRDYAYALEVYRECMYY